MVFLDHLPELQASLLMLMKTGGSVYIDIHADMAYLHRLCTVKSSGCILLTLS